MVKLVFVVLDVSFNTGRYTDTMKRQFLYINICSLLPHLYTCSHWYLILLELNALASFGQEGQNLPNLVW